MNEPNEAEIIDIEDCARDGRDPPKGKRYRIRVDKTHIVFDKEEVTGREILEEAEKTPPERFRLDQKLRGGDTRKIELDDVVDLTRPGLERFMTLPLDQTEGEPAAEETLRREFDLPGDDVTHLEARGLPWETMVEDGTNWLLIHEFPIPEGYDHREATTALRIPSTYPTAQIDMVFFHPMLQLSDGGNLAATQGRQRIGGAVYQRWSRHRTSQNPWRPGVDNVATHLALVEEWLLREVNGG